MLCSPQRAHVMVTAIASLIRNRYLFLAQPLSSHVFMVHLSATQNPSHVSCQNCVCVRFHPNFSGVCQRGLSTSRCTKHFVHVGWYTFRYRLLYYILGCVFTLKLHVTAGVTQEEANAGAVYLFRFPARLHRLPPVRAFIPTRVQMSLTPER